MTGRTIERPLHANLTEINLEHEAIQWLTQEIVRAGMETPLRAAILAAVEETLPEAESVSSGELSIKEETKKTREKSRTIKAIQGLTVFVVMFVVLYGTLKWLTSTDEP